MHIKIYVESCDKCICRKKLKTVEGEKYQYCTAFETLLKTGFYGIPKRCKECLEAEIKEDSDEPEAERSE